MKLEDFKNKVLADPEALAEYEALKPEFNECKSEPAFEQDHTAILLRSDTDTSGVFLKVDKILDTGLEVSYGKSSTIIPYEELGKYQQYEIHSAEKYGAINVIPCEKFSKGDIIVTGDEIAVVEQYKNDWFVQVVLPTRTKVLQVGDISK